VDIVCDALERFPRVRMGPRPTARMYAFFEVDGLPDPPRRLPLHSGENQGGPGAGRLLRSRLGKLPAHLRVSVA